MVERSEFVEAVRLMREHQRAWFGGDKARERLQASRKAEREVDRLLSAILAGAPTQADLFGKGGAGG